MRRLMCALAFTLAASGAAWADPAPAAAPGAMAAELVAQASAEDLFDVLPAEHLIVVRHVRSGLVCRMDPDHGNRIIVFPQAARGEDVACDSTDGRESITFYATRFSFDTTLQEQIDGAIAAIQHRFPDARPYSGALTTESSLPASRSVEFLVSRVDGTRMYTRASVTLINGWAIKMRYTVVAADDDAIRRGEETSDAAWRGALSEIASARNPS